MTSKSDATIYETAGGSEALELLTERFYRKVLDDSLLRPLFEQMPHDHVHNVALWLAEVFGGPPSYTAERGGHATMLHAHFNRGISEEQRARWVELMDETAREVFPADDRLLEQFHHYLEWGSRIAVVTSKPGYVDDRPAEEVPHWGWQGKSPDRNVGGKAGLE